MIFTVSEDSSTRITGDSQDARSAWLIHEVEGWYESSTDLETEPYAFNDGEALIRASKKGRTVKLELSYFNKSGISNTIKAVESMNGKPHTIKLQYQSEDVGKSGTESISGAYLVSTNVDTLSKNEFTVSLEFNTLNQSKTYS